MIHIRGVIKDTPLTGTIYEANKNDSPPEYSGAPELEDTPFVFVCDSFYEVESGGRIQNIAGEDVRIAFELPTKRGYYSKDNAINGLQKHIKKQFLRLGFDTDEVRFEQLSDSELREESMEE